MEITNRTVYLLRQHIGRGLDAEKTAELQAWASRHPAYRQLVDDVMDETTLIAWLQDFDTVYGADPAASIDRMQQHITAGIDDNHGAHVPRVPIPQEQTATSLVPRRHSRFRKWLPYAAAMLIAVIAATYIFFGGQSNQKPTIVNLKAEDVAPGGNRARLTLADGRTIDLSATYDGIVIDNENIAYNDGSSLAVISNDEERGGEISHLTLTTPRGGTYQLTLSDGSKVWLNAASTLTYPSRFNDDERVVELVGEGYFEIEKDTERPFKVHSAGQEVEVLGTEFNVSAYPDESEIKTTLIGGSVKVSNLNAQRSKLLAPSEQAVVSGSDMRIATVNTDVFTAWKEGFFYFDRLPTRAALVQLARWYDLELVFEGKLATVNMFAYNIERDKPLSAVLKSLEKSGLKFKVTQSGEQKQLIVLGEN